MRARRWGPAETAVALCLAVSFLLVWPVGDYLIDDDWAYTKSLERLHETGSVRILDWNPMTLVGHLGWGLLFTKLFGFGTTVTRVSTVALALVECLALIALLRHLRVREPAVIVAALALLFGPLHFFQSFLYSTDVPTNAWTMLSLWLFVRGLGARDGGGHASVLAGSAFAGVAWSVRQSAGLVLAGLLVYLLLFERGRLGRARTWLSCFGPAAVAIGAVAAWYFGFHGPTEAYLGATREVAHQLGFLTPGDAARIGYMLVAYVALFALPVLVGLPWSAYRPRGAGRLAAGAAAGILLAAGFVLVSAGGRAFPYLRNKLTAFGYLHPNELIVGARDPWWPAGAEWMAAAVLFVAAVGCALLLVRGLPAAGAEDDAARARRIAVRLLGIVLLLQLVYAFVAIGILFDRHLVMAAPVAVALFVTLAEARQRLRWPPAAAATAALALYAIAGTHDIHAFSRAAFAAGRRLMDEGKEARLIDAGYAFDGWHMYERSRAELAAGRLPLTRRGDAWYLATIAPRVLSKYVVALSDSMDERRWAHAVAPWAAPYVFGVGLDRYRPVRAHSYASFWPPGARRVVVLEDTTLTDPLGVADSR